MTNSFDYNDLMDDSVLAALMGDDTNIFSSGVDYTKDLLGTITASISHKQTKQFLDEFLSGGGKFNLKYLSNENIMEYDYDDNSVNISHDEFVACCENGDLSLIISYLSHELHHYKTFKNAEESGIILHDFIDCFDEKSIQIIDQGLEVGANTFQIITGWEQGGDEMHDFLVDDYKELFIDVETFLYGKNVKFGQEIPEKLLPVIGDMVMVSFTETYGIEYKKDLLRNLTPEKCDGSNKQSISATKLCELMQNPISLSEEQMQSKLMFGNDVEKLIPFNIYPYITMAPSGHESSINNKIESYRDTKGAIPMSIIKSSGQSY